MAKKDNTPSGENPHEHNVKIAIEDILGGKTKVRKSKKSPDDIRRGLFTQVIFALEMVENREVLLAEDFNLNLADYNDMYHQAIDGLLGMMYTQGQLNVIQWYLSDRIDEEGGVTALTDPKGNPVYLQTPADLYEFLKIIK